VNTAELLGAGALAARTGATYRQIHTWTRASVIETTAGGNGSGNRRLYHPNLVPIVRTLRHLSDALTGAPLDLLRNIADHHHLGALDLAHGIQLRWPTEHGDVDAYHRRVQDLRAELHELERDATD
jgi:DNA-binding transcriptional MerR regulator